MVTERYILGGRAFVPVGESTVEHDISFREMICQAGLDDLVLNAGEAPEDYARRLLRQVISTGKVLPLLGLLLIPEGIQSEDWTPDLAQETVAYIKSLPGQEVMPILDGIVLSVLIPFFASGLASLWSSVTSSGAAASEPRNTPAGTGNGPA